MSTPFMHLDDLAYTHVPALIASQKNVPRLADAETCVRMLDDLAQRTRGAPAQLQALLAVESLPGEQIAQLAAGHAVPADDHVARAIHRFELARREGMRDAYTSLDRALLLRAHRQLVPGGGSLRTQPVWIGHIGSAHYSPYVPPPAAMLSPLLDDLVAFLARRDMCPVAQAVVGYAQLESIHPFLDGNGRLGRWLIQTVLHQRKVVHRLSPPVGLYFTTHRGTFTSAITAFRTGDLDSWCQFANTAMTVAANSASEALSSNLAQS